MNKNGFAISTMLYGLIFITIAVFYLLLSIISNRHENVTNYANEAREDIKNTES